MHVKDSTIRVTWQLPQCRGNIRELKVQYRKKGQSKWQWEVKAAAIADTEVIITGLEKGVEYVLRVVVVDTNGETHEMAEKKASIDGKFPLNAFISAPLMSLFRAIRCICILFSKKLPKQFLKHQCNSIALFIPRNLVRWKFEFCTK